MIENKIKWSKPDYENHWGKVLDEEIDRHCIEGTQSGDIIIHKEVFGRKVIFNVYRLEKVGELIKGIETLTRQQLIDELKKLGDK